MLEFFREECEFSFAALGVALFIYYLTIYDLLAGH